MAAAKTIHVILVALTTVTHRHNGVGNDDTKNDTHRHNGVSDGDDKKRYTNVC